jgi:hypothetical protein
MNSVCSLIDLSALYLQYTVDCYYSKKDFDDLNFCCKSIEP